MGVVGDAVGRVDDLNFEQRGLSRDRAARRFVCAVGLAFEHFPGEVEAGEFGVARFQHFADAERLLVVVEPAVIAEALVEHVFAGVAEGRVAQVVGHGQRFDEIFVEPQRAGDGAGDRGDFERVRQPRAVVVAHLAGEHLRLVTQAAEGGAVQDAIAVALVTDRDTDAAAQDVAGRPSRRCAWRRGPRALLRVRS